MSASFFSGAHNFSVGEMNVKNVSGDYIDHSTKNVRNTFRGGNTYNTSYDQSYHDSSNHHYGHNYTTTNHNHGPVNNIERVDNANFGTNYGHMNQNTFDGPQQNYRTDHHYNAPTHNYDTHAPGGNVVNGDFNGTH
ncbi:hypothetical protein FA13DRAFT_816187 [Coprinellus micaceus]|uniref:Uncharacterized protein n=1 Tax=Coprinellus micaceus TaxID=71717 RepID=A0A4Y7T2H7_COPMI|nr:hypothetical protein FA13DRAFT_816187 [Coprinellus micaceus]